MSNLLLVATIEARDTNERDAILAVAVEIKEAVHREPGCVRYDVFTSGSRRIVFLEEWVDQQSLEAHASAEPFARLQAALASHDLADAITILPLRATV